jgi:hypothetical protein
MKKLLQFTFYLLITATTLQSCKEDDSNPEVEKLAIQGVWGVTQFNVAINISGISLADFLVDSLNFASQEVIIAEALIRSEVNGLFENQTITFKNDQTYEILIDSNLETGSWKLNDAQTILTVTPLGDQEIDLKVASLSDEVLRIELSELVQADAFLDTSAFGITLTEGLQVEGDFTLLKQK